MGDRLAWPWRRPRARHAKPTDAAPQADDRDLADTLPHLEDDATRPGARSLFGEILDWMFAPLLLLWPLSVAVTFLVARSLADAPFDRALDDRTEALAQQVRIASDRIVPFLGR